MNNRAEIKRTAEGFTATFSRKLKYPKSDVWQMLTDNEKLTQWFPELTFEGNSQNSHFVFDMGDGKKERLPVTGYKKESLLSFNWWEDHVRFELHEADGGTTLLLTEDITAITGQTAKDLAGWHVCLDHITNLLVGEKRQVTESWEEWHTEYKRLLDSMTIELE